MKTTFIISISTVLLAACATQKTTLPGWVLNPNSHPSAQEHLVAVGSGSTLDEASKSAFTGISRVFSMTVEGSETLESEVLEAYTGNQVITEGTTRLLNSVKIGTQQQLVNTNILEAQIGPDGTYYALAGMHRLETSRVYSQEISANTMRLHEMESQVSETWQILNKLRILRQGRTLAAANLALSKQQNILMRGSSDTELASRRLAWFEEQFREAQKQASFTIIAAGATENIIAAVAEVLHTEGFSESENEPVLAVSINFNTQKADLGRDDAEFVKWELSISVTDNQKNEAFKTYITEGRDGARTFSDALSRADYSARNKIGSEFRAFINQQLLSYN